MNASLKQHRAIGIVIVAAVLVLSGVLLWAVDSRARVVQAPIAASPPTTNPDTLLDTLRQMGFDLTFVQTFEGMAFVDQRAAAYRVGGPDVLEQKLGEGTLYLMAFGSSEAAAQVAANVPPNADNGMTDWAGVPHYFRCDNLIVIYLDYQTFNRDVDQLLTTTLSERCGLRFAGQTAWIDNRITFPTTIPTWTPAPR